MNTLFGSLSSNSLMKTISLPLAITPISKSVSDEQVAKKRKIREN